MNLVQAAILGAVEGLTEFLPVSSTGHLIIVAHLMGLVGGEMGPFEIVIQAGALLAVVWLYRGRIGELLAGAVSPTSRGRALLVKLFVAFLPAAIVGLAAHRFIHERLFGTTTVAVALIAGGVLILATAPTLTKQAGKPRYSTLDDIPLRVALWIGLAQCLSLWPGTSRALATMLAALLLGASPVASAEFSFLLALPTLGMATLFDLAKNYRELTGPALGGPAPLAVGLLVSAVVAVLAIQGFLRYVVRRGLAPFGWYRIGLGLVVLAYFWHHPAGAAP